MKVSVTVLSFLAALAAASPSPRSDLVARGKLNSNLDVWNKLEAATKEAIKTMQDALEEVDRSLMSRFDENIDYMIKPAAHKIIGAGIKLVQKDIKSFAFEIKDAQSGEPAAPRPAPGASRNKPARAPAAGQRKTITFEVNDNINYKAIKEAREIFEPAGGKLVLCDREGSCVVSSVPDAAIEKLKKIRGLKITESRPTEDLSRGLRFGN